VLGCQRAGVRRTGLTRGGGTTGRQDHQLLARRDGLGRGGGEAPRVAEGLQVAGDDPDAGVVRDKAEVVGGVDAGLVAHRDHVSEAGAAGGEHVADGVRQRAAARDQRDRAGVQRLWQRAEERGEACPDVRDPVAVRPGQRDIVPHRQVAQLGLDRRPVAVGLGETAADEQHGAGTGPHAVPHGGHGAGRAERDGDEVDRCAVVAHGGVGGQAADLVVPGVDRHDLAGESAPDQLGVQQAAASGGRRVTDHRHGARVQQRGCGVGPRYHLNLPSLAARNARMSPEAIRSKNRSRSGIPCAESSSVSSSRCC